MKIGIVGSLGVVGKALEFSFSKLGHNVCSHDIRLNTHIEDVLDAEVVYICVPTNSLENGKCDVSIVEDVVQSLQELDYTGIICIKSTVEPGTTDALIKSYNSKKICFVPEFLRERCAVADFTENHDLCVIGTEDNFCFEKIAKSHGKYPKNIVQLKPIEAELCKYFCNCYNATLITFANSFYALCNKLGVDYSSIKDTCVKRNHIADFYLDCNDQFLGFGGTCLPKDLKAVAHLLHQSDSKVKFFDYIIEENSKHKKTVFNGMRS